MFTMKNDKIKNILKNQRRNQIRPPFVQDIIREYADKMYLPFSAVNV